MDTSDKIKLLKHELRQEQLRVERMKNSLSWKVTAPLRSLQKVVAKVFQLNAKIIPRRRMLLEPEYSDLDKSVAIVVCVHNALQDVKACLTSAIWSVGRPYELIIVNDGSDEETTDYLSHFKNEVPFCRLIHHETPRGYTCSANVGMRASKSDYCLLLNSDTVLTRGSVDLMIHCAQQNPNVGIVGPLSNAASYQSIPKLTDENGKWLVNELPAGWSPQDMADLLRLADSANYVEASLLNGFCTLFKKKVFERVGYLDEEAFPIGYGEENDFCLRAEKAGFKLRIATQAYVYHAKSKSFGSSKREEFNKQGAETLVDRYGKNVLKKKTKHLLKHPTLKHIRSQASEAINSHIPSNETYKCNSLKRIMYLLPVKAGSGGAHSVIQEVRGMQRVGVFVQVAVPVAYKANYSMNYPNYKKELFFFYNNELELERYSRNFHVVVATIFTTVKLLKTMVEKHPHIQPAYYIQDYEPWFEPEGSWLHKEAFDSYDLIPGMLGFAKTSWLIDKIAEHHDLKVSKVQPSLDHSIYYPASPEDPSHNGPVVVSAMIRPKTPRRNAELTMKVLSEVKRSLAEKVEIHIFGCEKKDPKYKHLIRDFAFVNHELCTQQQVAEILRNSDVFVDFSTYQAFGRTGLEAMACGSAVILPKNCGTAEYAIDGENASLVDTSQPDQMVKALAELIENPEILASYKRKALETAKKFNIDAASSSILDLLPTAWNKKSKNRRESEKNNGVEKRQRGRPTVIVAQKRSSSAEERT